MLRLKCRQAARLLSEGLDRPLAAGEAWPLRLHLLACANCRNYGKQLQFLRRATRAYGANASEDPPA
jgi:hypothetical protein